MRQLGQYCLRIIIQMTNLDIRKPIIFALALDGRGGATEIPSDDLSKSLNSSKAVWIHLDQTSIKSRETLENLYPHLSNATISALLTEDVRGRAVERDGGILAVIRGANLHEGQQPEHMISLRCFLSSSEIITVRKYKAFAIEDVKRSLSKGNGPSNSTEFMTSLSEFFLQNLIGELDQLEDQIDSLEELVMDQHDNSSGESILEVRRSVHHFLRHLEPQVDVYHFFSNSTLPWMEEKSKIQFHDLHHEFSRIVADLKSWRERTRLIQDELGNSLSKRLDQKLYLLAVLTAIFLPLSFMTGLFGINLGGMPGANEPWAFWTFTFLILALAALEIYIFKSRKWF